MIRSEVYLTCDICKKEINITHKRPVPGLFIYSGFQSNGGYSYTKLGDYCSSQCLKDFIDQKYPMPL